MFCRFFVVGGKKKKTQWRNVEGIFRWNLLYSLVKFNCTALMTFHRFEKEIEICLHHFEILEYLGILK